MGWAQMWDDDTLFQVRVAGVAVADGRVLLHRTAGQAIWSLPGGRLQVGETAAEALRREMVEEIETSVQVGDVLWLIENFFEHQPLDNTGSDRVVAHHEIGFYLEMRLPDRLEAVESFMGAELAGTDDEFPLEFRWFPRSGLAALDLRPALLQERLGGDAPVAVASLVSRTPRPA